MSGWKVQKFFGDLVYDMRSRGLLPLAALLVVAMIAVPWYVTRSGAEPGGTPPAVSPGAQKLAPENQAAVVAYKPGVRDYQDRLAGSEKNPFRQQYPGTSEGTAAADSVDAAVSGSSTDTGGSATPGTKPVGGGDGGSTIRYFYFETDFEFAEAGKKMSRRNRISAFDSFPNDSTPVVTFSQVAQDGKHAVFLVSRDVVGVDGDGTCWPKPEQCEAIALAEGDTVEMTYAKTNKVYRFKVARIEFVTSKKPPE